MAGHHHHGGCCGNCDHDETPELGILYSLYQKIDVDRVECLNETTDGSGKLVFKPWEDRLDDSKIVESDVDEELLFNIPFTANIKLKGIIIIGGEEDTHPNQVKLYKNRPNMTFDDCFIEPDEKFELQRDTQGTLQYSPKIVKFSNVYHLSLHFPSNFGSSTTKIQYIGLRGEFSPLHRHEVTICTYEARPNPAEHDIREKRPEEITQHIS